MDLRYAESHLYTISVKKGVLPVDSIELDRVKKSVSYRVLCVTGGECHLFIAGSSYRLQTNDICFLRPGDLYRTVPIQRMTVLNIYFTFEREAADRLDEIPASDQENAVTRHNFTDLPLLNVPFVLKNFGEGIRIAEEMFSGAKRSAVLAHKQKDIQLEALMMRIICQLETQEADRNQNRRILSAVSQLVQRNIHEQLTCRGVAAELGYHPNYLNRIVQDAKGVSLHRYILEQKIKSITEELTDSDKPIAQIAQEYAFFDSSHLARSYFSVTKLRPSEVRRAAKK